MMGVGSSEQKKRQFGEVFTPAATVFVMVLDKNLRDALSNEEQHFLDPCVGQGQFTCAILIWKFFFCLLEIPESERKQAALTCLKSLHGIDIQGTNIEQAKAHMLATFVAGWQYFFKEDFPEEMISAAQGIIQCNFGAGNYLALFK